MHSLLRLPLILLEMALRGGAGAVKDILRLVVGGGDDERPYAPTVPVPDAAAARRAAEEVAATAARARRPEARPRGAMRTRPVAPPTPATPPAPAPTPEAELLGDEPAHVTSGVERVASFGPADDPSPTLQVQAPWDGYDGQPAAEIVKRVRAGDEATKAVVLLYERGHKDRASVVRAAGGQRTKA